ncbi:MAG: RNA methyltransferase [Clostridia bacterium]|nr:RNA methyltransferase [Clostridia bacterium]
MDLLLQNITSKSNPKIVRVAKYAEKKYRDSDGVFVCEGLKLLEEAVLANANIREIYIDSGAEEKWRSKLSRLLAHCANVNCYRISGELYRKISGENSPQGILAVIDMPSNIRHVSASKPDPLETVMMFESVRDPGNMGTLIRTAAAFGFDRLILSADCADVFNPKVLRGAMGAIFKIKVDYCEDLISTVNFLNQSGRRTMAALPKEKAAVAGRDTLYSTDCVVIGNEGHGLSENIIAACSDAVYIPMMENTESLNAAIASSILMWEIAKIK